MSLSFAASESTGRRDWLGTFANVALVVASAAVVASVAKGGLFRSHRREAPPPCRVGERLASIPGAPFAAATRTLLLAFNPDCPYCEKSAPFYRELSRRAAANPHVRLVGLGLGDLDEAKRYLADRSITPAALIPSASSGLRIRSVPTLITVDSQGLVTGVWTGYLDEEAQEAVLRELVQP